MWQKSTLQYIHTYIFICTYKHMCIWSRSCICYNNFYYTFMHFCNFRENDDQESLEIGFEFEVDIDYLYNVLTCKLLKLISTLKQFFFMIVDPWQIRRQFLYFSSVSWRVSSPFCIYISNCPSISPKVD